MHVDKTKLSGPVLLACLFEDGVQLQLASTLRFEPIICVH